MWWWSPVRGFSASTRTPTSIEVRHAAFTLAVQVTSSPTLTGRMNVIRSIAAVTTRLRQCRIAAMPATSSQSFITIPPWTNPAELASPIPIHLTRTASESAAGLGSIGGDRNGGGARAMHSLAAWPTRWSA